MAPRWAGQLTTVVADSPASGAWTERAPLPGLGGQSEALTVGGQIDALVQSSTVPANSLDTYSAKGNAWSVVSTDPIEQPQAALAASTKDLYVIGGLSFAANAFSPLTAVTVHAPALHAWRSRAPLPSPGENMGAVLDPSGTIYVMGGTDGLGNPLATAWAHEGETRGDEGRREER